MKKRQKKEYHIKTNQKRSRKGATADTREKKLFRQRINPHAAGIDVGAEELVVAVPEEATDGNAVRTFRSFTGELHQLKDWLLECNITTVAMESTGNYWVAAYQIIEDAGIEVCLVNARHVKGVPGRPKTDVHDAQWLQRLHQAGLLNASFRPASEVIPMRYLMRHRESYVRHSADILRRMQKVLTEMNVKLHHVFSDIDGVSAQRIIAAILEGERNGDVLWELRDGRCRASKETFEAAINGDWREEYLFVLRQCVNDHEQVRQQIAACDEEIGKACTKISPVVDEEDKLPPAPKNSKRLRHHKNTPAFSIYDEAYRLYGVDTSEVDGISAGTLAVTISELGNRDQILAAFRSSEAFVSWLSICPDNRITGGRVHGSKTRKSANRVAQAFRLCAYGLNNSDSELGRHCRRMKARLGKAEGLTATAHKLARIFYAMIESGQPYSEDKAFKINPRTRTRQVQNLKKNAARLGYEIVPIPSENEQLTA